MAVSAASFHFCFEATTADLEQELGSYAQGSLIPRLRNSDVIFVIATQFDFSSLTAKQIVELNESAEFLKFKDAMIPLVERMPRMDSRSARQDYYETMAREVINRWHDTRKLISERTGRALIEAAEIKTPEFASNLVHAGIATWVCHPIGTCIFAGVLAIKIPEIYRKWREGEVSFRYLTKVEQAGAILAGGAIGAFAGNPEYGGRVAH